MALPDTYPTAAGRARPFLRAWACLAGVGLLLACGMGCAPRPGDDFERYYPPEAAARRALETGLDSWHDGQLAGTVLAGDPSVVMVDSHRQPGQKLRRYEILGALPGDGPRRFTVRLTLDEPEEQQRTCFLVVGVNPLWVYRQEDYDMLAHWECATTEREPRDTRPSSTKQGSSTEGPADGGVHRPHEKPGGASVP
jgi:hypothetical protein